MQGGFVIEKRDCVVRYGGHVQQAVRLWVMENNGHWPLESCLLVEPADELPRLGEYISWRGDCVYFDNMKYRVRRIGWSFNPPREELGEREVQLARQAS